MSEDMNQYTNINYEGEDVMVQISKRFKHTQQGLVDDIASSIESIAKSLKSINESHSLFLEVNKMLTLYFLKVEKKMKERNFNEIETISQRLESTPSEGSM